LGIEQIGVWELSRTFGVYLCKLLTIEARMRRVIFHTCLALLACTAVITVLDGFWTRSSSRLTLFIDPPTTTVRIGERVPLVAQIHNTGGQPVTLVHPGDGSLSGWRTPIVGWSVRHVGANELSDKGPGGGRRCGNINALEWDEVFRLSPGETATLSEWAGLYAPDKPGIYTVRMSYSNRPGLAWSGVPLGVHNPLAMTRIKLSTECDLVSNEVQLTVTE
jgi:hypothetical protein